MRTTILLPDELAERFRSAARVRGQSLSAFLAEAGKAALGEKKDSAAPPFELVTHGSGGVKKGVDLDHAGALLAAEDEERYGR